MKGYDYKYKLSTVLNDSIANYPAIASRQTQTSTEVFVLRSCEGREANFLHIHTDPPCACSWGKFACERS